MTNQQENFETIKKRYVKANASYKQSILRKYGVKDINKLSTLLDNSAKEVKCNMTELASVLKNNPAINIKVSFQKTLKEHGLFKEIMLSYNNSTPLNFEKELKTAIKKSINGETRIVEGFHNNKLDFNGRIYFTESTVTLDKSKSYDNRMILISLNHLNFVEVNGVKYILK